MDPLLFSDVQDMQAFPYFESAHSQFKFDAELETRFRNDCASVKSLTDSLAVSKPGPAASQLQSQIKIRTRGLRALLQQIKEYAEDEIRSVFCLSCPLQESQLARQHAEKHKQASLRACRLLQHRVCLDCRALKSSAQIRDIRFPTKIERGWDKL